MLYLTPPGADAPVGGQTFFPDAGARATPSPGAVLSFENRDAAAAAPHAKAKHGVRAVPKPAAHDRFVAQLPIGRRPTAPARPRTPSTSRGKPLASTSRRTSAR